MRLLHLADLHLGWRPPVPEPWAQQLQARRDGLLRQAVAFALEPEHRIDGVLIAGDLFDHHRPSADLVERVLTELSRLTAAGKPVLTVPGNHDELSYHDSVYRRYASRWPGHLVTSPFPAWVATWEVAGVPLHLYGAAFTAGVTPTDSPWRAFPHQEAGGYHVAVFHGTVHTGAGEPWAEQRTLLLDLRALAAAGYDYVALGHWHQPWERVCGRGLAAYAGAPAGKGFADPGCGTWTVVCLGERQVQLERPAVADALRFLVRELDAGQFASAGALWQAMEAATPAGMAVRWRVRGTASFAIPASAWAERLTSRAAYAEVVDETVAWSHEALAALAGEPTVRGEFVRELQSRLARAATPQERAVLERALVLGLQLFAQLGQGQARGTGEAVAE